MQDGLYICVPFSDLPKAFDSLDHCILLHRICNWVLANKYGLRTISNWGSMCWDSPGKCFGPLLFLIYVNSLPSEVTDGVLLQYADDPTLVCSGVFPLAAAEVMNQQLATVGA